MVLRRVVVPERFELGDLRLERWRPEDAEALARAAAESLEHLRPWMPWAPLAASGAAANAAFLAESGEAWDAGRHQDVALWWQGRLVGGAGLRERLDGDVEVGYWLHVAHTGRGHMTAAAGALVGLAFDVRGARRVVIRCDQANARSAAVAERLGFRLDRLEPHPIEAPGHTGTFQVWVLDAPGRTGGADLR